MGNDESVDPFFGFFQDERKDTYMDMNIPGDLTDMDAGFFFPYVEGYNMKTVNLSAEYKL